VCKVAFLFVRPNEYRTDGSRLAREVWVRIPGKHGNEDMAWDALHLHFSRSQMARAFTSCARYCDAAGEFLGMSGRNFRRLCVRYEEDGIEASGSPTATVRKLKRAQILLAVSISAMGRPTCSSSLTYAKKMPIGGVASAVSPPGKASGLISGRLGH
jgi:hypothetical protein